jgi:hypothetical protein
MTDKLIPSSVFGLATHLLITVALLLKKQQLDNLRRSFLVGTRHFGGCKMLLHPTNNMEPKSKDSK